MKITKLEVGDFVIVKSATLVTLVRYTVGRVTIVDKDSAGAASRLLGFKLDCDSVDFPNRDPATLHRVLDGRRQAEELKEALAGAANDALSSFDTLRDRHISVAEALINESFVRYGLTPSEAAS